MAKLVKKLVIEIVKELATEIATEITFLVNQMLLLALTLIAFILRVNGSSLRLWDGSHSPYCGAMHRLLCGAQP